MRSKVRPTRGHGAGRCGWRGGRVAAVVAAAAFAVACGGPGPSPASGYVNGAPVSSVAIARCMRAHGVPDFPDPSGGQFDLSGIDQSSPRFQRAARICVPSASAHGPGPARVAGLRAGLKFSRCMRAHKVPGFPDPTASNGSFTIHVQAGSGVNPHSPLYQAAVRACRSMLPPGRSGRGFSGSAG